MTKDKKPLEQAADALGLSRDELLSLIRRPSSNEGRRFEGFAFSSELLVLDTQTGEVQRISQSAALAESARRQRCDSGHYPAIHRY